MIWTLSSIDTLALVQSRIATDGWIYFPRFGGDFAVIDGHDAGKQPWSQSLASELREAFQIEHVNYVRSVPICYPNEPGMDKIGLATVTPPQGPYVRMMEHIEELTRTRAFANANALTYLAVCQPMAVRVFLDALKGPKLFVGSLPRALMAKLFGPLAAVVEVPAYGAYDSIERWWPEVASQAMSERIEVIFLAAGLASRAVAKRLWGHNVRKIVLDLGSWIDAFAGKDTRTWIRTARANGMLDGLKTLERTQDFGA